MLMRLWLRMNFDPVGSATTPSLATAFSRLNWLDDTNCDKPVTAAS